MTLAYLLESDENFLLLLSLTFGDMLGILLATFGETKMDGEKV